MKPVAFRARLSVWIAIATLCIALSSFVITFVVQIVNFNQLDPSPPETLDYVRQLLEENPESETALLLRDFFTGIRTSVLRAMLTSMVVSTLLWIAFAIQLGRRVTYPVQEMVRTSSHIAAGDFSARIDLNTHLPGELRQLLEEFNRMAERQESNERERSEMIASIAHELRTPLAVARARLELMEEGLIDLDKSEVTRLSTQLDLLTRIVNDLRTLSLADAKRLSLNLQATELHLLVAKTIDTLRPRAAEVQVGLESQLSDITLDIDPQRTQQVLINLLDNALKHTPANGVVTVTLSKTASHTLLEVRDTGPGFAVEPAKLFERFYTSEAQADSLQARGTGLGLSLVAGLVELHGGHVSAKNHPAGGAVFSVQLPLDPLHKAT